MQEQNIPGIIKYNGSSQYWTGNTDQIAFEPEKVKTLLQSSNQTIWVVSSGNKIGAASGGAVGLDSDGSGNTFQILGQLPNINSATLGDNSFKQTYQTRYAYYTGAMANGIASEELVITTGRAGLMGSFGAAGLGPERVQDAIHRFNPHCQMDLMHSI